MNLLIALVIVVGGWWLIKSFAKAQPQQIRKLIQKAGGIAVIAFAGFLTLRGEVSVAVPLFLLGLGMIGQQSLFRNGMPWQRRSAGQTSSVATSLLAMELDHDTGRMEGEVLAGPLRGRKLSSLTLAEARTLHGQCAATPDQSRALLETWIERHHPDWRAQWGGETGRNTASSSAKMTRAEALAILGLKDSASSDDIRAAHRRLMKAAHPDLGGTDYLAAKINEAKEFLLQDGP